MSPNETAAATGTEPRGGVMREWVIPIVSGLVIGALLVLAWKHGRPLLRSDAENLVRQWAPFEFDANDELEERLRKLGKEARADLLRAFRAIEVPANPWGEDEQKVWAARILAGDPYFDTRSLLEIVRDPASPAWDRRAASAALVHTLQKDVDTSAVTPVLLDWVDDRSVAAHGIPLAALGQLQADKVFPPDLEPRLRKGVLALASRSGRPAPADEDEADRVRSDREAAVHFLGDLVGEDDVRTTVWGIASDEADDQNVRAAAIQVLAVAKQWEDPAPWATLAKSADVVVRQMVADNLGGCPKPEFDAVLAPLHEDAGEFVRKGSIETQVSRNRPTMLAVMGLLVEDHSVWVRREAMIACGLFKSHLDGLPAREGMILRLLESSDADEDVEGAIVALALITGQTFGFAASDVDLSRREVDVSAIASFKADAEGRREAVRKWREHLGGTAVWTDGDRRQVLEKMLRHADPENRERAKAELAKLK